VRRKVTKVARKARGASGGSMRGSSGAGGLDTDVERKKTVPQLLSNFRVSEERLAKFREYQVLVFTGEGILSGKEKEKRKIISSTPVRH